MLIISSERRQRIKEHIYNILLFKSGVLIVLGVYYIVPMINQYVFANPIDYTVTEQAIPILPYAGVAMNYQGVAFPYQGLYQESLSSGLSSSIASSMMIGIYTMKTNQPINVLSGKATTGIVLSVSLSGGGLVTPLVLSSIIPDQSGDWSVAIPQPLDQLVIGSSYDIILAGVDTVTNRSLLLHIPQGLMIGNEYNTDVSFVSSANSVW